MRMGVSYEQNTITIIIGISESDSNWGCIRSQYIIIVKMITLALKPTGCPGTTLAYIVSIDDFCPIGTRTQVQFYSQVEDQPPASLGTHLLR